jgi:hypothetical protein
MISQHYQDRFPRIDQFPPAEYPPFTELIRKARLYDEMMRQPDCPDPKKEEWMRQLDAYMKERFGLEPKTP